MAYLHVGGAHAYTNGQFMFEWTTFTAGSNVEVLASGGSSGGPALKLLGGYVRRALPVAQPSLLLAFRFKPVSIPQASNPIAQFLDNITPQVTVSVRNDGAMQVLLGGSSGTAIATSAPGLVAINNWYYLEIKAVFSLTAGSVEVRLNNIAVPELGVAGANTAPSGTATVTQWSLVSSNNDSRYEDWVVIGLAGAAPTNFMGDSRVLFYAANGDGFWKDWIPSTGASHFAVVDERPADTTDYVSTGVAGARDSFTFVDVATEAGIPIHAISFFALMDKTDTAAATGSLFVRAGGTDYDGPSFSLDTTARYNYLIHGVNPATGLAWTASSINAAEFGIRKVA